VAGEQCLSEYVQPVRLAHALNLLDADPSRLIVAGATDVYPAQTSRAGWGHIKKSSILDISRLADLRGITETETGWRIGALTTWTDIAKADALPPLFDGLKAAAREIGGVQIQNRGTIAGNICTASPAGDSIPCLLTLDAVVHVASRRGTRAMSLARFITGYREADLRPGELVTHIDVPHAAGIGHFLKLGARRYLVISIAMVAGVFDCADDGTIRTAKIAVGACSAVAQRLHALEARMVGQNFGAVEVIADDLSHLAPIDDVRANAAYRRAAALQLVTDLIAASATTQARAA
jgi:CO/xanthine dehydrogenase FAD-binding subunit